MWRRSLTLSILLLFLFSCTAHRNSVKNSTVLTVNGQSFTGKQLGEAMGKKLKMYDALAAKDPINIKRAREQVIQEFVVSALLSQYAKEHDISVPTEEVNGEMDHIRKGYPDDLTFKAALATEGTSLDEWKAKLRQTLLERKVFGALTPHTAVDDKADESDARLFYESHKTEFVRPLQIRLQQIVVPREDDAERILHKIKAGESFSSLAQKFSISPDATQGGDIGYISKGTTPAFDSAFSLKTGQISGVVKSSYGFHIMKVLDKRAAGRLSFEQVKARLMREAASGRQQDVFNKWLEGAVKGAKIERNDSLLEKIRVRTEGEEE